MKKMRRKKEITIQTSTVYKRKQKMLEVMNKKMKSKKISRMNSLLKIRMMKKTYRSKSTAMYSKNSSQSTSLL